MITPDFVRAMSRYNKWQNANLYGAADRLPDGERKRALGAFFGSIHGTLNHILWGDRIWMSRFCGLPRPAGSIKESPGLIESWDALKRDRQEFDEVLIRWADGLDANWLTGDLTWVSGISGREVTRPRALLVAHMFNHQTHHRGQVHCLLTQCGAKPGDTDLPFTPQ